MSTTEIRTTKKRTTVAPANVIVQKTPVNTVRTSMGGGFYGGGGGNVIQRTVRSSTYSAGPGLKPGAVAQATKEGVNNVLQTRDKEKIEMTGLNTKLANYIECVAFLEGQIKGLTAECERLKNAKGYDQKRVADLYKEEMQELRDTVSELQQAKAPLESKLIAKDDEIEMQQERIKDLEDEIKKLYEKIKQLCNQNEDIEGDCKRLQNENDQLALKNKSLVDQNELLLNDNKRLRNDLQAAIEAQLCSAQRCQELEEELDFLRQGTDEEIAELREIIANFRSNPVDVKGMWKKNFATAMNNLQDQYKDELERATAEMRRQYDERIQTIQMGMNKDNTDAAIAKTESKTLKSQLGDNKNKLRDSEAEKEMLRRRLEILEKDLEEEREECSKEKADLCAEIDRLNADIDDMQREIAQLTDKTTTLDMEISCYKKLIEGEERNIRRVLEDQHNLQSQGGSDLSQLIMGGRGGGSSMTQESKKEPLMFTMSESSGKIHVKKTSKCAVSIDELSHDGASVTLVNSSGSKDMDLGNWVLERNHPKGKAMFKFSQNATIKRGQKLKIWGAESANNPKRQRDDIVGDTIDCPYWGMGDGFFSLKDASGMEKAHTDIKFQ